jgi:hypothetical protein
MAKTNFLKTNAACIVLLLFSFGAYTQTCQVDRESLKGTYTGDCKKDKAHGKGKAVGADTYEGEFKNGIPDGTGTYTWSNKNVFVGKYVKGLREGKGTMTFKQANGKDSVVEGYWTKDVYVGKNEKPWQVISKTSSVRSVEVEYIPNEANRVKVIITNTTGGTGTSADVTPKAKVDNIIILKGNFQRQSSIETHYKSSETTLFEVSFPFRIKLQIGREEVEVEMFEVGSYSINISINN